MKGRNKSGEPIGPKKIIENNPKINDLILIFLEFSKIRKLFLRFKLYLYSINIIHEINKFPNIKPYIAINEK